MTTLRIPTELLLKRALPREDVPYETPYRLKTRVEQLIDLTKLHGKDAESLATEFIENPKTASEWRRILGLSEITEVETPQLPAFPNLAAKDLERNLAPIADQMRNSSKVEMGAFLEQSIRKGYSSLESAAAHEVLRHVSIPYRTPVPPDYEPYTDVEGLKLRPRVLQGAQLEEVRQAFSQVDSVLSAYLADSDGALTLAKYRNAPELLSSQGLAGALALRTVKVALYDFEAQMVEWRRSSPAISANLVTEEDIRPDGGVVVTWR